MTHRLILPGSMLVTGALLHLLHIAQADWGWALLSAYPHSDAAATLHAAWYTAFVDPDGGFVGAIRPLSPYVAVQTLAYRAFGPWPWVPLAVNATSVVLGTVAIALAARRSFGDAAGWSAGLLAVLAGPLVFFAGVTMKTSLVVCLLGAALWAAASHFAHPRLWKVALVAALLGIGTLERPNLLLVLLVFALVAMSQYGRTHGVRRGLLSLLIPVALIGAGYGAIWANTGQLEPTFASPMGLNFYAGNAPDSRGWYTPVSELPNSFIGHRTAARTAAQQRSGTKGLSKWESSQYWFQRAFDYYRDHPGEYAVLQLRKLGLLLAQYGHGEPEQYRVWRWERPALRIAVIDYGLILALAGAGWFAARRNHRANGFRRFLAIGAFAFAASLWLFFVNDRYRISLLVLMMPFAGYGAAQLWQSDWPRRIRLGCIVLVFYGVSYLLTGLLDYSPGWPRDLQRKLAELDARRQPEQHVYALKVRASAQPTAEVWAELSKEYRRRRFEPDAEVFARRAIALAPARVLGYRRLYEALRTSQDRDGLKRLRKTLANVRPQSDAQRKAFKVLQREINNAR